MGQVGEGQGEDRGHSVGELNWRDKHSQDTEPLHISALSVGAGLKVD